MCVDEYIKGLMMPLHNSILRSISIVLLSSCITSLPLMVKADPITAAITTEVGLQSLKDKASKLLGEAQAAGDYLATKAAIEALNTINELEAMYARQLDSTVTEIDGLARRINDVDALLDDGFAKLNDTLENVSRIEERLAQILADTPLGEDGPYISRIQPTLLSPTAGTTHVTLSGVDIHSVEFPGYSDQQIEVSPKDSQNFLLSITSDVFEQSNERLTVTTIPVTLYGDRWFFIGPRRTLDTEITLGRLPEHYASFTYKGTYKGKRPERRQQTRTVMLEGKNTTKYDWARPSDGWSIDVEKPLKFSQGAGIQGRCEGDDPNHRTKNGIRLKARVDHLRSSIKYPLGRDGYVNCSVTFTEYRLVPEEKSFSGSGTLGWRDDEGVTLPDKNAEVTFSFDLFNGRKVIYKGSDSSNDYIKFTRDNTTVIIRPKRPSSL
ncbi:hypothetical protein ND981_17820 [Vibrio diabolicus]|uniref:hypothetical protein n=1 Tax=Vibrio diabolicus TaxID=50719 RepID=UPI00215F6DA9|nr:hypothetical protein [Vibrio diabolicus]MCS0334785.1 hypothetical protein [Vibrio diabolicus]